MEMVGGVFFPLLWNILVKRLRKLEKKMYDMTLFCPFEIDWIVWLNLNCRCIQMSFKLIKLCLQLTEM